MPQKNNPETEPHLMGRPREIEDPAHLRVRVERSDLEALKRLAGPGGVSRYVREMIEKLLKKRT